MEIVMDLFEHSNEYMQIHYYAYVSPCDSEDKIKYSVTQNFIASIR